MKMEQLLGQSLRPNCEQEALDTIVGVPQS